MQEYDRTGVPRVEMKNGFYFLVCPYYARKGCKAKRISSTTYEVRFDGNEEGKLNATADIPIFRAFIESFDKGRPTSSYNTFKKKYLRKEGYNF